MFDYEGTLQNVSLPGDVLKFGPEGLVEPSVEDWVGEGGGHPDEMYEGEADAAHRVTLKIGCSIDRIGLATLVPGSFSLIRF